MLIGTVSNYMAQQSAGKSPPVHPWTASGADMNDITETDDECEENDAGPASGLRTETMIWLVARYRKSLLGSKIWG